MARCPSCNRFVSLELSDEPEVNVATYDAESDTLTFEARLVRMCAECGEEMSEATVSFEKVYKPDYFDPPMPQWVSDLGVIEDLECEVSANEQTHPTRRRDVFYGVEGTVTIAAESEDGNQTWTGVIDLAGDEGGVEKDDFESLV